MNRMLPTQQRVAPTSEQIAATDPDRSNWVGANAGSGKTHVLIQRVARLLLDGAEPQRILCLTYTKTAAAEMQSRLFRTLGKWAMAPAEELGRTLADLAGADRPVTEPEALAAARRLFARALETPGGLKIQTIHAFCTEVLRRFPLEAGVSPRFEVADDRRSRALLAEVRAALAEAAADAFDCAARVLNEGDIDALAEAVLRRRVSAEELDERIAAHFGADGMLSETEICRDALEQLNWPTYQALRSVLLDKGGKYDGPVAEALGFDPAQREGAVERLIRSVLTKKMEPRGRGFPAAEVKRARPQAEDELRRLTDWALETRARICTARIAARVRDLHRFAQALLEHHDGAKGTRALLDFDDLVERSRALMTDGVMRGWVLWKLDQGLDHILVDEAQDTAPAQWEVIAAIAEEFFAGAGARPAGRSIFVVGDEKQSIYSFQGAEPHAFGRMRAHFSERLDAIGTPLGRPDLKTSYRSAPAILDFVDAVFAGPAGEALTVSGEPVRHVAHRQGAHGRVDLWPVIGAHEDPKPRPWFEPVDAEPASDTKERLACAVAKQIEATIGTEWLGPRPPDRPEPRPIRAGDVLVLVAKRDRLAAGIIRELKKRGVPVAGADRMVLTSELAVQDLLALAKVASQPGDDLSVSALLRSPLCGISEDELFELAHRREGSLWQAVQRSAHRAVADFLADMAAQADFLRPYEFLERVLVRHDGRRRLLARLGTEAEDAMDELLAQAFAYESSEAPSLTGFVAWIEASEIQVKREMETGDHVRVMTVHGAKGLEAPVVILPDTISGGRPGRGPLLLQATGGGNVPELVLWAGSKSEDDPICAAARAEAEAREKAERKRLLYVALTRAEDWLILCGAGLKTRPSETWYEMLAAGMDVCDGVKTLPSPTGEGDMRRFETGTVPRPAGSPTAVPDVPAPALPAWVSPARREARWPRPSPSSLAPADAHGGAGIGRALALRLGSSVHRLLERLPGHAAEKREALAARLLAHEFPDLADEHRRAAWAEAAAVLAMPGAELIFGPDSLAEVAAAIPGPDGVRMTGRIDRLVVGSDNVLVIDFKTDRALPASAAEVPRGYLAQLGAYCTAVAAAFPGRRVEPALLWTAKPTLMRFDSGLVDLAFRQILMDASRNIDSTLGRP